MANGIRTTEERLTALEVGLLGVASDIAEMKNNVGTLVSTLARRPSWSLVAMISASLSLNVGLLVALVGQLGK